MQEQIIVGFVTITTWIALGVFISSICFEIYTSNTLFFDKIGAVLFKISKAICKLIALIFDCFILLITSPLTAFQYALGTVLDIILLLKDITRYQSIRKWITTGFYEYDIYDWEYQHYYRVKEKYQPRLKGITERYNRWLHNYWRINKETPTYRMWFLWAYVCRLIWYGGYLGVYYILYLVKYGLHKLCKAQMAELIFFSAYFLAQTFKVEIGLPLHKLVWTIYTFCKQQLYYITPNFLIAHLSMTLNLKLFEWYTPLNMDEEFEHPEEAEMRDHWFALHWAKSKPIQSEFVTNGLGTYAIYFKCLWIHLLLVLIYIPIWVLLLVAELLCKQLIRVSNLGIWLYQYLLRKQYKVIILLLSVENLTALAIVSNLFSWVATFFNILVIQLNRLNSNELMPYVLLFPIVISYYLIYYIINIVLRIPGLVSICFIALIRFLLKHRLFWLIVCAVYWIDISVLLELGYALGDNVQSIFNSFNLGNFFGNFMLLHNPRMEWTSSLVQYFYPWAAESHRFNLFADSLGYKNYPEDAIGLLSWYVDPEQWCDAWNWDNPYYHWRYEELGVHPPRPDWWWRKDLFDQCYPFEACYHRYRSCSSAIFMLHQRFGRQANTIFWPEDQPFGGTLAVNDWWYINKFSTTLYSAKGVYKHLYSQHSLRWMRYGLYARNWRTHLFLMKQRPFAWFALKFGSLRLIILNKMVMSYTFYWLLYSSYNPFYGIALMLAILQKLIIILPYTFLHIINSKFNETFPSLHVLKSWISEGAKFCWANLFKPGFYYCLNQLRFQGDSTKFSSFSLSSITYALTSVMQGLSNLINYYIISSWLQVVVSYFSIDEYWKLVWIQAKYYKWLISITINFPILEFKEFWNLLVKPILVHDRMSIFIKLMYWQFTRWWEYICCLLLTVIDTFVTRPEILSVKSHNVATKFQYNDGKNYHQMIWNEIDWMVRQYSYPLMGSTSYIHRFFDEYKLYTAGREIRINKAALPLVKVTDEAGDHWVHINQLYTQQKPHYLNFYYYLMHNRRSNKYFIMYDQDNLSRFNYALYNEIISTKNIKTVFFNRLQNTALYTLKLAFAPLVFITKTPSSFDKALLLQHLDLRDIITIEVSPYSKLLLNTGILSPLLLPLIVIIKLQLALDSLCIYLQIPRRQQKYRQRFSIRHWLTVGRGLWIQPVRRSQLFTLRKWKPTNNDLLQNFLHFTTLRGFEHLIPHQNTCNDSLEQCNWEPGCVVSWMPDTYVWTVEASNWWTLNHKLLYSLSISSIFWYFITLILLCVCSNSFVYLICSDELQFKQRILLSRQYNWDLYRTKNPAARAWLEFNRAEKEDSIFTKDVKLTNDIKEKLADYERNFQHYIKLNPLFKLDSTFAKMYNQSVCKFSPNDENEIFISPALHQYHLHDRYAVYARNEHIGDRTYLQFVAYGYGNDYHIKETWQQPDEEEYEHIHSDYRHDQREVNYYMFKQDKKLYPALFNLDKHIFNMQLPAWVWHKDALNLRWYDLKDSYTRSPGRDVDIGMAGRYVVENDDDQGYIPFAFLCWFFVVPLLLVMKPYLFLSGFWTHYIRNPFNISHHLQKYTSSILNHLEVCHNLFQWATIQHPAYKRGTSLVGRAGRRGYIVRMDHIYYRNFYHVGAGLLQNVMGTRWSLFAPQTILFACKEEIKLFYYFNMCAFTLLFIYLARRSSKERKLSIRNLNSNLNTHFVSQLVTAKATLKQAYLWFWR